MRQRPAGCKDSGLRKMECYWVRINGVLGRWNGRGSARLCPRISILHIFEFQQVEQELRLASIQVQQPHPKYNPVVYRLFPPLPDLRYGAPTTTFKSGQARLHGQGNYYAGEMTITGLLTPWKSNCCPTNHPANDRPVHILHRRTEEHWETHSLIWQKMGASSFSDATTDEECRRTFFWIYDCVERNPHRISHLVMKGPTLLCWWGIGPTEIKLSILFRHSNTSLGCTMANCIR